MVDAQIAKMGPQMQVGVCRLVFGSFCLCDSLPRVMLFGHDSFVFAERDSY